MGIKTALVGVRMPVELVKKMDKLAEKTERTRTFILTKAAEMYLKEIEDYETALFRLHDSSDPVVSWEEMRNRAGN